MPYRFLKNVLTGIGDDKFVLACLIVDKMDKISESDIVSQLVDLCGVEPNKALDLVLTLKVFCHKI